MTTGCPGQTRGMTTVQDEAKQAADSAQDTAEDVHHSRAVQAMARLGLYGRSLVWLIVGGLAIAVAVGRSSQQTDREGALRAVASQPLGQVVLLVAAAGFVGYALWRLLAAAVGHREDDGLKRTVMRVFSFSQTVMYGFLAYSTVQFVFGGTNTSKQSGDQKTRSEAARLMQAPGGRWILGAIGLGIAIAGIVMVVQALRGEHDDRLDHSRIPDRIERAVVLVGTVGRIGRSVVLVLIGAFLVDAAVQFDPDKAKGLNATLATLASKPHGEALLLLAALGLLTYGLWSVCEATWRDL